MTSIFLSYSFDRDVDFVKALRENLERLDGIAISDSARLVYDGSDFVSEIRSKIENCDVFVCIVGLDRPNILLETGIAMGTNKDIVLIANSMNSLPVSLLSLPIVLLTGDAKADSSEVARRITALKLSKIGTNVTNMTAVELLREYKSNPRFLDLITSGMFEELVVQIFLEKGFEITTTSKTSDAGYDILLRSPDDLQMIAVQCKRYARQARVSIAPVRELMGGASLMNADVGILVTTSSFTSGARALAAEATAPKLALVTMDRLLDSENVRELWGDN